MNRQEADDFLKQHLDNINLLKHSYAVEVVMRKLANHFDENEDDWGIAGLLHDIDYEQTKNDPEKHSLVGGEMLKEKGISQAIVDSVITHNESHNIPRESMMAKSLYCVDPLTGLIVATALVLPEKNMKSVTVENVLNRFKEKSFAKGATRETILKCKEINLSLEEFVSLGVEAMKTISNKLGL
jgi:uncharacterized protein